MTDLDRRLIGHLTDPQAVAEVFSLGLRRELFEEPVCAAVYDFALDYWLRSGMEAAPTASVLEHEFPGLRVETPEETAAWLVDKVQQRYATNHLQDMLRQAATASFDDPVGTLRTLYTSAYDAAESVTPRLSRVNMSSSVADRRRRYGHREDRPGGIGLPYGIPELDEHTGGNMPGELAVVGAYSKTGKAQPVHSRVATPQGWVRMGDLSVGDLILGSDGHPQKVVGVFDRGVRRVWEVETTTGVTVEVCGEHLWSVHDRYLKKDTVLTTEEMASLGFRWCSSRVPRFRLPVGDPAQFDSADPLRVDPYLLGALLGDGGLTTASLTFTNPDGAIHDEISRLLPAGVEMTTRNGQRCRTSGFLHRGRVGNQLVDELKFFGLIGCKSTDKFIPDEYKTASVSDRLSLIQGLLDTDGTCEKTGSVIFTTSSCRLMEDFREIVQSLGGTATLRVKKAPRYQSGVGSDSYSSTVRLPASLVPFRVSGFKLARLRPGRGEPRSSVSDVRRTSRFVQMRCIAVSNADCLYRTDGHTLTHNTFFLANTAVHLRRRGYTPMLFTLEMSIQEIEDRIDALWSGVSYNRLVHARLTSEERQALHVAQDEMGDILVESPDEGERTVTQLVNRARQAGADYVLIDQLSFIEPPPGRYRTTKDEYRAIMKAMKNELRRPGKEIPALMAVQLNRESLNEPVQLKHFADASDVERFCDLALALERNKEERANHVMRLHILGGRRTEVKSWLLGWELQRESRIRVIQEIAEGG